MPETRISIVDGGSGFVLSLLHGAAVEAAAGRAHPLRLTLYDVWPEAFTYPAVTDVQSLRLYADGVYALLPLPPE